MALETKNIEVLMLLNYQQAMDLGEEIYSHEDVYNQGLRFSLLQKINKNIKLSSIKP